MLIENWIYEKNLLSFCQILASIVSYTLDNDDYEAIKYNYRSTSFKKDEWFKYALGKDLRIDFSLEDNSTHINVKIECSDLSDESEIKIKFLFDICQYYFIKNENLHVWYKEL